MIQISYPSIGPFGLDGACQRKRALFPCNSMTSRLVGPDGTGKSGDSVSFVKDS